ALKNRWEHVLAYWALQTMGGVPVPVNHRFAPAELAYVLGDSGARVVLFERATAAAVLEPARGESTRLVYADDDPPGGATAFASLLEGGASGSRAPEESDLSLILYTSGTTGRPKGVPRTHRNHAAGALAQALQCGYEWGERMLGTMPLYHT